MSDDRNRDTLRLRVTVNHVVSILALGMTIFLYAKLDEVNHKRDADSRQRLDQTCFLFETDHLRDVKQLKATYKYLLSLKPSELGMTINKTVIAGIPETEAEARTDRAPEFCDEKGRGLPEPDPKIPVRPKGLKRLLPPPPPDPPVR